VTQEVAYDSMPFAFRAMLHERVGLFLERSEEASAGRLLDLLAHHFWHSANDPKKREYLGRAGDAAQAAYANAVAIDYFERLAGLVEATARADVLLKLIKVLDVIGDWKRVESCAASAFDLAEQAGDASRRAACETALAEVARKQGRYDEAAERLGRAAQAYAALGDDAGLGQVLHLEGTVAAQRGNYERAVESYQASLAIRERLDDRTAMAALLSNLGIVEEYRGHHDSARQFHERALAIRTDIGDRRGIGNSTNCLGMVAVHQKRYAEARDWFQRSMQINHEIGERWMVAICHNNLGNATRGLGDYAAARRHYAESLRAHRDYHDRWALAFLLEDVGLLAALESDGRAALELLGAADAARESIGAPRSVALEEEIAQQIAPALAGLPEDEREARRAHGRTLNVEAALMCAEAVVAPRPAIAH
jgi:tetratricopeptide (TPR) repeat protein